MDIKDIYIHWPCIKSLAANCSVYILKYPFSFNFLAGVCSFIHSAIFFTFPAGPIYFPHRKFGLNYKKKISWTYQNKQHQAMKRSFPTQLCLLLLCSGNSSYL